MTDYLNPHRVYPDCPSRRIDNPPGNDSIRADDLSNAYSDGLRDGAPKWIKTADRLPTAEDGVIGATGEPEVLTICEHAHGWFPEVIRVSEVVRMPKYYWYWMPLPKLPEVEG